MGAASAANPSTFAARATHQVGTARNCDRDLVRVAQLSKDYEFLPQTTEAWIYLAMSRLMLRRLVVLKT